MPIYTLTILATLAIVLRLIPHLPDFSPLIPFCYYFGLTLSRSRALGVIVLMVVVSDSLLSWFSPFSAFGNWTWFTYSAYAVIGLSARSVKAWPKACTLLLPCSLAALFFWLWTNLGTWLVSGLYPFTAAGFLTCYTLALPFLGSALISSCLWAGLLQLYEAYLKPYFPGSYSASPDLFRL